MAMEIKINAGDMLKVLVNAGIEATDAKAIIFDLLQYPDGGIPERKKLKEIKQNRKKLKRENEEYEKDERDERDEDSEDIEDEDVEDEDDEDAYEVKRPKRINFRSFGGTAKSLKG